MKLTWSKPSLPMTVLFTSLALLLISIFMRLAGFFEKRLLGHCFGAGDQLDVYLTATKVSLIAFFALRGVLRPVITPLLTQMKNRSLAQARNFGFSLALLVGAIVSLSVVLGLLFTPEIVRLIAPGFETAKQLECVRLTRWLMPPTLLMCLSMLMGLSLQTQKRIVTASLGEFVQKISFLAAIVVLAARAGLPGVIAAYWMGVLAMFGYYVLFHFRHLSALEPVKFAHAELRQACLLAWPIAIGAIVSQAGRLLQGRFASDLPSGSIAALTFAQTLIDMPLNLIPLSLSFVLLPYFSEFADRNDLDSSRRYLASAARLMMLLFAPLAIYLLWFKLPILHILFKGGRFDQQSIALTAQATAGLCVGLPFFALEMIVMNYFYASRHMKVSMICGLVGVLAASAILPLLKAGFGLAGVSAYLPVARVVKLALLTAFLSRLKLHFPYKDAAVFLMRLAGALCITAAACGAMEALLRQAPWALKRPEFVHLAAHTVIIALAYPAALCLLGFEEWRLIRQAIARRMTRGARRRCAVATQAGDSSTLQEITAAKLEETPGRAR